MKIKKGDVFTCIKNVKMDDGEIVYYKGLNYSSDQDDCITNDKGDKDHWWGDCDIYAYFKIVKKENIDKNTCTDRINPNYYKQHPSGVECIDITKHYDFCIGNAIKYLWRSGLKQEEGISNKDKEIEDLKKALWYIQKKIEQLEKK